MTMAYLVVDMPRLLDDSTVGRSAARSLQQKFKAAQAEHKKLQEKAAAAKGPEKKAAEAKVEAHEKEALQGIRDQQATLRATLLKRAQGHLEKLMKEKQVTLVLERGAVLMCEPGTDVTQLLMSKIDEDGPLSL
ncbi:MAG: OmpH family outer membrane protein [Deltaproteobacteria bacterium]|nr:OmpH family outer membrane protein [Deltaproteobacteria bacterium]